MNVIPLLSQPSQTFRVVLNQQDCQINLYQKASDVFFDLYLAGSALITCMLVRDRVLLVRQAYLGFNGDFIMQDMQGTSDPDYTGFGTRYILLYLEPSDL